MAETNERMVEVEWYGQIRQFSLLGGLSVKTFLKAMEDWKRNDPYYTSRLAADQKTKKTD